MLDLQPEDLREVRAILAAAVPGCEVRAYGSRVAGTACPGSDLDLVLVGPAPIDPLVLARLGSAFEESDLPFSIDLLDWNAVPDSFRDAIAKRYEVISEP